MNPSDNAQDIFPINYPLVKIGKKDKIKVKVSEFTQRSVCSTLHSRRSGMDHRVLPAITSWQCLPLPRKRSADDASTD